MITIFFLFLGFILADDGKAAFEVSDSNYAAETIDKLRDSALNTQLQLRMFQEIMKQEGIQQTYPQIVISLNNQLSERYKILSLEYSINGLKSYFYQREEDSKRTTASDPIQDYVTNLPPGKHKIQVILNLVGNDSGVFSYLAEYKVPVLIEQEFELEKNKNYGLQVKAFEKGSFLTDFKDRAKLSIQLAQVDN